MLTFTLFKRISEDEKVVVIGFDRFRVDPQMLFQHGALIEDELMRLSRDGKRNIVLDFHGTIEVHFNFFQILLAIRNKLQKANLRLVVCNLMANMAQRIKIPRLDSLFFIYQDQATALSQIRGTLP